MLKWLKMVVQRIGRLVTELLGVKTLIAVIMTLLYRENAKDLGLMGFVAVTLIWSLVIGLRYAIKVKALIAGGKE